MNDFTGRRPSDAAKRISKGFREGFNMLGIALADGPKRRRIEEIDALIIELNQERDHLIKDLIEPGDLKVSENYDPRWTKTESKDEDEDDVTLSQDGGRLTTCEGRDSMSVYHNAHPGCPYLETVHIKHEFTLRD